MDYEKMYKAVLKTATQWIKDGCSDKEKICLESIFPELRESEDERIARAINNMLPFIPDEAYANNGVTKEDVLAWLEKQKDERELGYIEGKVEGVRQTCQEIKDAMSLFEPKDLTPFEFTFRDYIDSAIRYCLSGEGYQQYIKEWSADLLNLEKQKEHQNNSDAPKKALGRALTSPLDKDMNLDEIAQYYVDGVKEYNPEPTWDLMQTAVCYGYHLAEQKLTDYPYLPGWRKNRDDNKPELKRSVLMLTTHGVAEGEWLGEKWCQYRWSCELKDGEVLYWMHLSDLERLETEGDEKQKEPHYTKRNALFDKCVENCDPKTVEEVNKRVDDIINMPELSAFEQALTNLIGDWEDDEEKWPSKFVKKRGKHILDTAREELQKEQKPALRLVGDGLISDPNAHFELESEQKPAQSDDEKEYVRTLKGLVSDFIRNTGGGITDVSYYQRIYDWLDGRHIEQKPAEWSEDTLDEFTENIRSLITRKLTYHDPNGSGISSTVFIDDETAKDIANGVLFYVGKEAVKNPHREIPEWSKEDERKLQRCIEIVESWEGDYDIAYTPYSNFLKSLRPQSKQKQNDYITPHKEFFKFIYDRLIYVHRENPNVDYMRSFKERLNNLSFGEKQEWSEEDEDKVVQYLHDRDGGMLWSKATEITRDILDMLRPSWKPSEEQMKALCSKLPIIRGSGDKVQDILQTLYDDLKKLM